MKCCGSAGDAPFRLVKGAPELSGVVGAVPALRLEYFSDAAGSGSEGENEGFKGEGCVVDRWLTGAA